VIDFLWGESLQEVRINFLTTPQLTLKNFIRLIRKCQGKNHRASPFLDNIDGNPCLADKLCVFGQTEQFKLEVEKRVFPSIFTKSFRDFADFFNLSVTI